MDLLIPEEMYKTIAESIHSDTSPVGIDAQKTHVIIIRKLLDIEEKLDNLKEEFEAHMNLKK